MVLVSKRHCVRIVVIDDSELFTFSVHDFYDSDIRVLLFGIENIDKKNNNNKKNLSLCRTTSH